MEQREERRKTFDTIAEAYDSFRPSYPEALIDQVLSVSACPPEGRLLEIGSGPGIATLPFARGGYAIDCIEPGANLLAIAAEKLKPYPGVRLIHATFEDWELTPGVYDLVYSASAFHWIQEEVRYSKTAAALKPGGSLALLWNRHSTLNDSLGAQLNQIYAEVVPGIKEDRPRSVEDHIQRWVSEIDQSGYYGPVEVRRAAWSQTYTRSEYLGLLNTYSGHLILPVEKRKQLFEAIGEVIDRNGGTVERRYVSVAYIARKRSA